MTYTKHERIRLDFGIRRIILAFLERTLPKVYFLARRAIYDALSFFWKLSGSVRKKKYVVIEADMKYLV